jgi:hypothetical protein
MPRAANASSLPMGIGCRSRFKDPGCGIRARGSTPFLNSTMKQDHFGILDKELNATIEVE